MSASGGCPLQTSSIMPSSKSTQPSGCSVPASSIVTIQPPSRSVRAIPPPLRRRQDARELNLPLDTPPVHLREVGLELATHRFHPLLLSEVLGVAAADFLDHLLLGDARDPAIPDDDLAVHDDRLDGRPTLRVHEVDDRLVERSQARRVETQDREV